MSFETKSKTRLSFLWSFLSDVRLVVPLILFLAGCWNSNPLYGLLRPFSPQNLTSPNTSAPYTPHEGVEFSCPISPFEKSSYSFSSPSSGFIYERLNTALPTSEIERDIIDHCRCSVQDVRRHHREILESLNVIVRHPYFRYFRADLNRPCPFWAVQLICSATVNGTSPCTVRKCEPEAIPASLRTDCGMDLPPSDVSDIPLNRRVTAFRKIPWSNGLEDTTASPCPEKAEYVDLVLNPESNTYYTGALASNVWRTIYEDNCFRSEISSQLCTQELLYYQLLSGLHTSISVHLCGKYHPLCPATQRTDEPVVIDHDTEWEWNLQEFRRRVGDHTDRIRNLHILYLFVMRAVSKSRTALLSANYSQGSIPCSEDIHVLRQMERLLSAPLLCIDPFNEVEVLKSSSPSVDFVKEMNLKLQNVTRIMDCLSCEKCRLWGKVQLLGLNAAVRIVLSNEAPHLGRSELISLINLFRQISDSIHRSEMMSAQL